MKKQKQSKTPPQPEKRVTDSPTKAQTKRRTNSWWLGLVLAIGVTLVCIPFLIYGTYYWMYHDKIYPGVFIMDTPVGGKTIAEVEMYLEKKVAEYTQEPTLSVTYLNKEWHIPLPTSTIWETHATAEAAFAVGREDNWLEQISNQWQAWHLGKQIPVKLTLDDEWLTTQTATIAADIDIPLIPPAVHLSETKQVVADKGQAGLALDQDNLQQTIETRFTTFDHQAIPAVVKPLEIVVSEQQLITAQTRGQALLKKNLTLATNDQTSPLSWKLSGEDLLNLVSVTDHWSEEKLTDYLIQVAEEVDRPPQNAKFQFEEATHKVVEFAPALDGLVVDIEPTSQKMMAALNELEAIDTVAPVILVMERTTPEITLASVNDLGIKELLGRGESTYKGSIPSRVHNVALAASRINGTLVKPGETFSFNQAVGDISAATGYQAAYVIRQGRTELGDGGGVCQDSTTVFRAALNAGLPIEERRAHAYRVGYYEQDMKAGIDATVYAPSPDLKFTNDTPAHLLIQAKADSANRHLVVEIYGTSDGRVGEISNHTVCCITPPPPDVYVDDPTLPTGQIKEVEHKVAGAKARFDYKVTRGGTVIYEKIFLSTYKPWAAVFMRGTGPQ